MFKYNGWAASAAYMSRMTDTITVNPLDRTKTQAVFVGDGIDTQLSYVFLQIIK
jgi:predicted GNAT family acetyltransferase